LQRFHEKTETILLLLTSEGKKRLDNKIEGLLNKQKNDFITHTKKIKYFCCVSKNINYINNEQNKIQFSFFPLTTSQIRGKDLIEVNLDPQNYSKTNKYSPLEYT